MNCRFYSDFYRTMEMTIPTVRQQKDMVQNKFYWRREESGSLYIIPVD